MSFKPPEYPSVCPYLIVPDARAVIDFAAATFGAELLRFHEREDGSIIHAELRVDDSVVMLGQATGEAVQEPTKGDDSDRRGGVKGPGGNTWWIGTQVG